MSNARFSILQARAVKDKRISDSQFRTLAALGMYADADGWCFPMLATLGIDLSKSKQAVGRDTIALRKLGYLEVQARFDKNGSRRSSMYRLRYDLPPVNVDDSTPSTSGVDTPSTSGVDVNDPSKDPINDDDIKSIIAKANKSVDAHLAMINFPGAKREARISAIQSYLGETFHRNTETKEWLKFAKFIDDKQQKDREDVKVFVSWLFGQKGYDPQFWPVSKMMEFWPSAFIKSVQSSQSVRIDSDGIPETY